VHLCLTIVAQLGCPDMRGPIGYALNYPERSDLPVERLDFGALNRLDFESPDAERFPSLRLAREALEIGGGAGAVLNASKEIALDAFLDGHIGFLDEFVGQNPEGSLMEIIASIPLIGGFLATVIPFILVLGIVVAVHEYGHYIVGRWSGIHAEVFSVGYGKPIWTWHDKHGTQWQIAWLPLGGYVKFLGDANASSFGDGETLANVAPEDHSRAFPTASVGARAATVAAGPIFNFILSAIIFTGIFLYTGKATEVPTVGELRMPIDAPYDLKPDDQILEMNGVAIESFRDVYDQLDAMEPKGDIDLIVGRNGDEIAVTAPYLLPPLVSRVAPLSPASDAGLLAEDLILSLGGTKLSSFDDLKRVVLASEGQELEIVVLRDGAEVLSMITPKITDTPKEGGGFEKKVMIGVSGSLAFDVKTETENLQGPLGIAQISGESAGQGLMNFIELVALLSTAIGMLNLFPIPILDGGHLVIFGYEAVAGKQPSDKVLNMAMSIGFVLLMALMVFATYNDIVRMVT